MILKKKKNHLYLKLERNEPESFGNNSQGLFFTSDLIIDLLAYEVIEPSFMSLLKQINKGHVEKGFCMVILFKETSSIFDFEFLNIVPTLIEAEDYIQIEQIQRDLRASL